VLQIKQNQCVGEKSVSSKEALCSFVDNESLQHSNLGQAWDMLATSYHNLQGQNVLKGCWNKSVVHSESSTQKVSVRRSVWPPMNQVSFC